MDASGTSYQPTRVSFAGGVQRNGVSFFDGTVSLGPIANLFLAGHRIRLDISSSNFPKFDVNPNTGEPDGMARRKRVAANTVFVDAGRPSRVVLPLTGR